MIVHFLDKSYEEKFITDFELLHAQSRVEKRPANPIDPELHELDDVVFSPFSFKSVAKSILKNSYSLHHGELLEPDADEPQFGREKIKSLLMADYVIDSCFEYANEPNLNIAADFAALKTMVGIQTGLHQSKNDPDSMSSLTDQYAVIRQYFASNNYARSEPYITVGDPFANTVANWAKMQYVHPFSLN